ncbi:hypothetical protein [Aeromicrobium sp. CnD17-E]|uniref:hypothetical protein n=1 Tax=Aeromicrobium sp. CnD17-E TaxID=2954487 RepID=UPI002096FF5A|nr:hypothetical protein [Aeromicrobium sp. CnD17-E]MCO7238701.1 hypothetical protein [Aeromicrobium sp. CnD17-E]
MTDLAYMVREDWAQHGSAMHPQSQVIRSWAGELPHLFAVHDLKQYSQIDLSADHEAAEFIAPGSSTRSVLSFSDLRGLLRTEKTVDHAVIALHPSQERDLDVLQQVVAAERFARLFVLVWSPGDAVRAWLDGRGAVNLHIRHAIASPDPLLVAAAKMMVAEEYNGLSSGIGKDSVVCLVRVFAANGYPPDTAVWLRAYFAAGGTFRHAKSVEKLVGEVRAGVKHRVKQRYVVDIFEVINDRVRDEAAPA